MSKQPEALRLADALCNAAIAESPRDWEVADELRRQHALIEEMREFIETAAFTRPHDIKRRDELCDKAEAQQ